MLARRSRVTAATVEGHGRSAILPRIVFASATDCSRLTAASCTTTDTRM